MMPSVSSPSETELYLLFDRSPVGMYRTTEDGRFVHVNPALVRLLAYGSTEELLQANLNRDIYVDADARRRLIDKYRPLGVVDGAEVQWKTRDGRVLTVQIWGHVVETSTPAFFDASVLDVTELRTQRQALEQTAAMLEQVVLQMPAIYRVVDRDLRILRAGGAIEQILGYPADRFVGRTLHDSAQEDPSSVDPIEKHNRALAGEIVTYENEYRGKLLALTVVPARNAEGAIVGAIGTCIDVTLARQLERRMVDAQRAESLGVLAGGLAHDFNNLLVAVIGNADLALRDIPPRTPGRAAIENIRDAGLRAAELTAQLLAYAGRGGAGTSRIYPATVVEELLRIVAPSMPAELAVTVDIPATLALCGDPTQVRQVLLNLVNNARDAGGKTIAITARRLHHAGEADPDDILTAAPGDYVVLDVADDGPGMDHETRRHVFEPFFTTKQTGHGLGLAAVLGIVRAHGGGIRVVSSPGAGARFQILWPSAATATARAVSPVQVAARTVLVIDDEDLVRDVVARMVEDLGYAALTAADGAAGLELVAHRNVDAVLVDLTMPNMSGADVIAALRERRPGLPVVLCSGYDRDGRGPVKADAYLPKPFRIDALERMLAKLLPPS